MAADASASPLAPDPDFAVIFQRLRSILVRATAAGTTLAVAEDSPTRFCLEAKPGPMTLKAWRGDRRKTTMPVAWVQCSKTYVSFHHMAFYGSGALQAAMSPALKRRMQGKTCFNFRTVDEPLFVELETLSRRAAEGMRAAGFVA